MKKQGFNITLVSGLSLVGVACGGGSSLLNSGGEGIYHSRTEAHSSESATVEDNESFESGSESDLNEEVPATVPVIISGSFLSCSLYLRNNAEHIACYPEKPIEYGLLSAGNAVEFIHDGQLIRIKIGSLIQDHSGKVSRVNLVAPLGTWSSVLDSVATSLESAGTLELNPEHTPQAPSSSSDGKPGQAAEAAVPSDAERDRGVQGSSPPKQEEPGDSQSSENDKSDEESNQTENESDNEKQDDPQNINLVVNGSFEFESPQLVAQGVDGFYEKYTEINGWSRNNGIDLEVQKELFNYSAKDGQNWLELCSTGNSGIKQDIVTEPGVSYTLKFHHSARPGTAEALNHMIVSIEGVVIQEYFMDGLGLTGPVWSEYFIYFAAGDSQTTITFESGGCAGSNSGTWIDDITVIKTK